MVIKITGHQWWWDVRYESDRPDQVVTTANEIYIPAGEPVTVKLAASDVIHSFWIPSLIGKQDLIPGQDNELQFTADRPGIYRGQCAEFCGWQHAHMGIMAVVLPMDQWVDPQGIKPGTNMPNVSLAADEIDPLVSYLEGLR